MIKPNKGFILCKAIEAENVVTNNGIEYRTAIDPRIRYAEVIEGKGFDAGTRVIIPMGFATECTLREIKYVFVKPENIVGYEDDSVQG